MMASWRGHVSIAGRDRGRIARFRRADQALFNLVYEVRQQHLNGRPGTPCSGCGSGAGSAAVARITRNLNLPGGRLVSLGRDRTLARVASAPVVS